MKLKSRDLSDWLSPVLVKEMRQGLKGKAFVAVFLIMHGAMLASMAFALAQPTPMHMAQTSTGLFWTMTVLSVLVLSPGLGLNALNSEMKAKTFELMILSRLSAWRIVSGKWSCVVAQAALIASSLLPYLVVRYFLGGVNLLLELAILAALLCASAVLIAMTVFASTYDNQLARLVMLTILGATMVMGIGLGASLGRPGAGPISSMGGRWPWLALLVIVAAGVALLIFILHAAATRVAPPAENHAAYKRGVAVFLLGLALTPVPHDFQEGLLGVLVPVLLLVCLDGCGERISSTASTYLPYAGLRGGLGAFAMGLYPGWPSALVFSALSSIAVASLFALWTGLSVASAIVMALSMFGTIVVPTAVARAFRRPAFVGFFALGLHGVLVLGSLLSIEIMELVGPSLPRDLGPALVPVAALVQAASGELDAELYGVSAIAMAVWALLAGLILWWRGAADVRAMVAAERAARHQAKAQRVPSGATAP